MEDVDVEPLGDPPCAPGVRIDGNPLVDHAGSGYGQRAIHDIRMASNPADIRHAPVNILGMDILDVLRGVLVQIFKKLGARTRAPWEKASHSPAKSGVNLNLHQIRHRS